MATNNAAEIIRRQIKKICDEMTDHENTGDPKAKAYFDQLLSNDFRIRRLSGVQNKSEFIAALLAGTDQFRTADEPDVYVHSDVAIASLVIATTTKRSENGRVPEPDAKADRVRNVRIFRRRIDSDVGVEGVEGWVLAIWHNSRIVS
jgi:hypothetical protein